MGNVRLYHLADKDLDAIRDFLIQQSPRAADDLLERIYDTLESLAE
jgi:plasmid stabilization system protein ParE